MNRKIFTLLAVALMLFSTAYNANAIRRVAGNSVGALVTTLPDGVAQGMYHIRVDSICLRIAAGAPLAWYPVSYEPPTGSPVNDWHFVYNPNSTTYPYDVLDANNPTWRDTIILAVTEHSNVIMISAKDLKNHIYNETAGFNDLQAAMWCIEVEKPEYFGQRPTFHFTNKVFDMDLDWDPVGIVYVDKSHRGWMYSDSYDNGNLNYKRPLRRQNSANGMYRVVVADVNQTTNPTYNWNTFNGKLKSVDVTVEQFVSDTVPGMLKFSIVKVSPIVLKYDEFNSQLGLTDGEELFKLQFSPDPTQVNYFGYYLKAQPSALGHEDYLNLEIFADPLLDEDPENDEDEPYSIGWIGNFNGAKGGTSPEKYNNAYSTEYLNILNVQTMNNTNYNHDYRFVFFPSEDSLVINAFYVKHDRHNEYANRSFTDDYNYINDLPGAEPYYYGLYNDSIHVALIVRFQDLSGLLGPSSMMTIGRHPANTRIYFGDYSCTATLKDLWMPSKGVYTIWDRRGRALGIRIYNGTYTPQWIVLEDDLECPDRIPSYQWTVEPEDGGRSLSYVKITSREFGDNSTGAPELVVMRNVMIRRGYSKIFKGQSQLLYHPLVPDYAESEKLGYFYQPITEGEVKGEYVQYIGSPSECGTGGKFDYSGFRPVINEFLEDEHLGYKWFKVYNDDPSHPKFGKSEDYDDKGLHALGMDYNAYAFNYFSGYGMDGYITLGERYNEQLLKVERGRDKWTGFQFMLAKHLRDHDYKEEIYGYPRSTTGWTNLPIGDSPVDPVYYSPNYTQKIVPVLKRYYYELKVADYYEYRDGLAEQFVVLKGAKDDNTDIKNAMYYGVDDIWGEKHPFKFANLYLRETYFMTSLPKLQNEERHYNEQTRRIYYMLLDRIAIEQIKKVTEHGLEVSDILYDDDGSHPYSIVGVDVDFSIEGFMPAIGKTGTAVNIATFALENVNYPLYRRLRSLRDDNASLEGDGIDPTAPCQLDAPKRLRINTYRNPTDFLEEDNLSNFAYGFGINYLGLSNSAEYPEGVYAADGTFKHNYHLFADTAYINRGTGPIKPQYLFAVGQKVVTGGKEPVLDFCDNLSLEDLQPYVIGRYLVNATDSARKIGSDGSAYAEVRDKRFIHDTDWDRLVFVNAVHIHDRLYLIDEFWRWGVTEDDYIVTGEDGEPYVHGLWLKALTEEKVSVGPRFGQPGPLYKAERLWNDSKMYGAYYDFGRWENFHNDVCFSLRFRQPLVQNPDENGMDTYSNLNKRFYIESETTDRTPYGNRKIAPLQGGWVMIENRVPVLSRTSYEDPIQQSEVFNIAEPAVTDWQGGEATGNAAIDAKVSVVAGTGFVTVFNATGKKVTVTNLLGQTVVNKVLIGDSEAIAIAKGLAVVTVEGEKAVKVVIK